MSAREISADNRKYAGRGGMIAERHSGNRRRIKRVISGARERLEIQKAQRRCRLPQGRTLPRSLEVREPKQNKNNLLLKEGAVKM